MATDKKTTDLAAPTGGVASTDKLYVIDVSDTTDNINGSSKADTVANVVGAVALLSANNLSDLADGAAARTNLDVYSTGEVDTALAAKADSSHSHAIADVTNLQTSLDGKVADTGDTMTGALVIDKAGGDAAGLQVDVRDSSLNTAAAFKIDLPATGAQKAFQAGNGTDTYAWASFEYGVGGAAKPGFALGPGTTARDVNLYRDSANVLKTDDALTIGGALTGTTAAFTGDVTVPDEAYGSGWDGSTEVPAKNAVYDQIESLGAGGVTNLWGLNFTGGKFVAAAITSPTTTQTNDLYTVPTGKKAMIVNVGGRNTNGGSSVVWKIERKSGGSYNLLYTRITTSANSNIGWDTNAPYVFEAGETVAVEWTTVIASGNQLYMRMMIYEFDDTVPIASYSQTSVIGNATLVTCATGKVMWGLSNGQTVTPTSTANIRITNETGTTSTNYARLTYSGGSPTADLSSTATASNNSGTQVTTALGLLTAGESLLLNSTNAGQTAWITMVEADA